MTGTGALSLHDLTVTFDRDPRRPSHQAVSGLDLTLHEDEVLAIVGESGCGKTLTGLAILGLEPPGATVTGTISLGGVSLRDLSRRQLTSVRGRRVAMVFQEPMTALNPSFTVGFQVAEVIRRHQNLTRPAARRRVADLFAMVRMPDPEQHLKEYPHQLSGGMRQRVMIAMAIACDPHVLIADEPTTALDPTIQAQILDLLRELKAKLRMSVILITHDLTVVSGLADRVLVMYAGHKIEEATAADLFRAPLHPYTRGLLNAVPKPGMSRETARLTAIGGQVPALRGVPDACVFADRCRYVIDDCRAGQPPLREVDPGHSAACLRAADVADLEDQ